MNNNKDSDKTYIVAWCDQTHGDVLTNREVKKVNLVDRYEVCDSYSDAIELYNQVRDRDYCYSANITQVIESTDYHQTRDAKIVDEPKEIDNDGYGTYLMLHLLEEQEYFTYTTCDKMWKESKRHIKLWTDSQYNNTDYCLYECIERYVLNLTGKSMSSNVTDDDGCLDSCSNNQGKCPNGYICELHEDERDEPKKITNDFDHWITELDTTAQNMADWLSNNTENFEEEPNIDSARTTIQEAVQLIQENKEKYVSEIPTANCVTAVLDYILYSEMGGNYDDSDPWHTTYQQLMELRNDKIDPEDLSYVSDLEPLH